MTIQFSSILVKIVMVLLLILPSIDMKIMGQDKPVNYDETAVPAYTLPDPLRFSNGDEVKDTVEWINRRRPEIQSITDAAVVSAQIPGASTCISWSQF
jgi:hypothetical protein